MAGEDSQLKVGVGTTYDGSGIDAANKAIAGFTKTSETNLDNLAKSAKNSSNALSQGLAKAASATATSGKAITKGSDQAAFALTNLGRVAQDAPFGFIGIQNNLNPLLESFQRLKAETGSAGSAFKALTSQLIGPAGFGLALSLVGSAILFYQQYQQKANKETENAKKVTDDYVKSLDAVTGTQLKGAQNAQKELTDLKLLYSAYTNANEPLKARQSAYKQLQEQYPQYFGNIKFEKEATDKTKGAYDLLTESILASARARAASDKITQNETRKLENEQKVIDLQREQLKLRQQQAKIVNPAVESLSTSTREGAGLASAARSNSIQGDINENIKLTNNLKTDTNLLDKENARLVTYVNTQIKKGGRLVGGFGDGIKNVKEQITKDLRTISNTNVISPNIAPTVTPVALPDLNLRGVTTGLSEYIKLMQEAYRSNERFSESVKNLAASTLESGLSQAFGAIGQSLAEGTNAIDAFGSALLSAFAGFLSQLGQMFIKEGIAQIGYGIAKNLILPGSGANNIVGGLGMIGAGAAISVIGGAAGASRGGKGNYQNVKQVRGFASGVQGFGGGMAVVGERGPELLQLPQGSNVIPNPQTRQFMNEQNGIVINGNFDIGLEKLYLRLEQTGKRLNRRS